jgi:cadmium resistance protein CadD (predicted permease)
MSLFVNRWLLPLVTFGFGVVVLVAMATDDDLAGGLVWFAIIAAGSALLAFGGRFTGVREARGEGEDERDALLSTQAMAAAGLVMILGLTGAVVFTAIQGDVLGVYVPILAAGGATYGLALLYLRQRS